MIWGVVIKAITAIPELISTGKEVVKALAGKSKSDDTEGDAEAKPKAAPFDVPYLRGRADAKDEMHQRELEAKMTAEARQQLSPWNPDGTPKE